MFQKPKGTEDFYPEEQAVKNFIFGKFKEICRKYGVNEIETPAFENVGLLAKKSGEEIKSQIFMLAKRENEEFGLRFDLTVPATRLFMQKQKELLRPAKWSYATKMWRYERPQAGRLREFYQMGVEIFGSKYPEADAEVISIAVELLKSVGLGENDFFVKLNNRKLLEGIILDFAEKEKIEAVIRVIDKRQKLASEKDFDEMLEEAGVKKADLKKLKEILSADTLEKLEIIEKNELASEGFSELKEVYSFLDSKFVKIDLSTARGLAYYTGTVFEICDKKGELRSICGGGRYDNLVELFGGQPEPATGFAMGLTTMLLLLKQKKMMPKVSLGPDYYAAVMGEECRKEALKIVSKLRGKYSVETDFMRRALGKQIAYANTIGAKYLIVIGGNELKSGKVKVKELATGSEEEKLIKDI